MGKLHEVEIHRLRPTQVTVGLIEVRDKRARLDALKKKEQRDFMEAHPIPGVWGPDGKLYITDHHHLGRAASEANVETGFFFIEGDFSKCPIAQFWPKMSQNQWAHPVDRNGKPCGFESIPDHLEKLIDDPYRSLAGYVRDAGGYDKTPTAFAEFQWADFFRPRVRIGPTRADFNNCVPGAVKLAASPEAAKLPGYKGPAAKATSGTEAPKGGLREPQG
ncbi:MAG: ParB-like protein [Steroidobacteraceae bacterium]